MLRLLALAALALLAAPAWAQDAPSEPEDAPASPLVRPDPRPTPSPAPVVGRATERRTPHRLDGPRVGITILDPGTVETINEEFGGEDGEERIGTGTPVITQFGWQFETRLFQTESGLTGVTEIVGLVGGLDRNLLLPSGTFLVGLRTVNGMEIGVGPNLSLAGTGYAVAVGMNTPVGEVNVPVNVAAVFGNGGPRISLLAGFTLSDRRY